MKQHVLYLSFQEIRFIKPHLENRGCFIIFLISVTVCIGLAVMFLPMADDFTYFAVTIIPNLLITGILAVIVNSLVIVWSVGFVHKKYGVVILLALSITQMLVGGGWIIDLALIPCILATRIDKPLNWWRSHLPPQLRLWFAKLFPSSLVQIITSGFSVLRISLTF